MLTNLDCSMYMILLAKMHQQQNYNNKVAESHVSISLVSLVLDS